MENQKALQLKAHSTALIATLTDPEKAKEFERKLTIKKIINEALPIVEVRREAGNKAVAQALDIQLTKLVANLNLKWNLSDGQISQVVEDLLFKYQNETIEDFILVFRRARMGEFGELMRLDCAVICGWMDQYLEEKYQAIEDKLKQESMEAHNFKPDKTSPDEWLKAWKASVLALDAKKQVPLTDADIKREGQEKPVKPIYIPPDKNYVAASERHTAYLKANYHYLTSEKLPGWMSEDKWNELNPI